MDYNYFKFPNNNQNNNYSSTTDRDIINLKTEVLELKNKNAKRFTTFIIVLIIANLIFFAIFGIISSTYINTLKKGITNDVVATTKDELYQSIANDIQTQYNKENKLPDDYSSIGIYVANKTVPSVVEIVAKNSSSVSNSSGFVITSGGYVMTNAHCVTYENSYGKLSVYPTVTANFYKNATLHTMEVIAYDTVRDLALLKFKTTPSNLVPVTFGDSDSLSMGEDVVAIGNAQGLGTSVTVGVVSQEPRLINAVEHIQVDAAINPGNSGGPLFDLLGNLVGVNTFKVIANDANEGLGFAISSKEVKSYIRTLNLNPKIEIKLAE